MSRPQRKYARFYYDDFIREYPAIYANDAAFACWMRLLTLAEKVWPTLPELPRHVKAAPLRKLTDAGLIAVDGIGYRVRGLDAERGRRSGAGRAGADARWGSDGNADRTADGNANAMPRLDETRLEPLTPPSGADDGTPNRLNPRALGTNPRAIAAALTRANEEAEKARKSRRQARYLAYSRGQITEAQRLEMDERDAPLSEISYQGVPA